MEKLKECPFCGKTPDVLIDTEGYYKIFCYGCATCSADRHTEENAIKAWNTRTKKSATAATDTDKL